MTNMNRMKNEGTVFRIAFLRPVIPHLSNFKKWGTGIVTSTIEHQSQVLYNPKYTITELMT